jgi:preprotein translocase subunit Sec61beta
MKFLNFKNKFGNEIDIGVGTAVRAGIAVCAVVMAISFTACAPKADDAAKLTGVTAPPAAAFDNKVSGPSLNGEWLSACVADKWASDYMTFDMAIDGQKVNRIEAHYADSACATPQTSKVTRSGLVRYTDHYTGNDMYEVEYKFSMTNGSYYTGENVLLNGDVLMISDRVTGALGTPDITLQKKH